MTDPRSRRPRPTSRRPTGLSALPSPAARGLAFGAIMVAGILGAIIGYGVVDVQCRNGCGSWPAVGAIVGALFFGGGGAVVAVLVLRASGEWRRVVLDAEPRPGHPPEL